MHQFNEHHPELKGFSEYFHKNVRPFLEARDVEREAAVKKAVVYCGLIFLAGLVWIVVLATKSGITRQYLAVAILTIMVIGIVYQRLLKGVTAYTKDQIVGGICEYVGWSFESKTNYPPYLEKWAQLHLIPKGFENPYGVGARRVKFEDRFTGRVREVEFDSVEVKLETKSSKSTVVEFHGQLMTLTFPRKFLGRTIVLQDKGRFQSKMKGDMKRVGLMDPVFEKLFEAYSTDQVESRYLLDPVFMQKLIDLERSVDGKKIRFGFYEAKLYIAVETGNRYEPGSMMTSLLNPSHTQNILDEIGAIFDIVDGVMKR